MPILGVNIDHVSTVREARKTYEPDPVLAARECEKGGCDSIVAHLREDRRHINDRDVIALRKTVKTRFNLEMSIAPSIVKIASKVRPDQATLVPERRQEITTEGGLDVVKFERAIRSVVSRLHKNGIDVSLFIDPVRSQIDATSRVGANIIELHTGEYANARTKIERDRQLKKLKLATRYAIDRGLIVNAGHGLDYKNVKPVARIPGMNELNIGHSIVSRSIFVGIRSAVKEMRALIS